MARGDGVHRTNVRNVKIKDNAISNVQSHNEREKDFTLALKKGDISGAYCVENDCAIEFVDGNFTKVISGGGKAYYISLDGDNVIKREL